MTKRPTTRSKKKEPVEKSTGNLREPSTEELEAAWAGPALHTNRFYLNVGPNVRIAFCEQAGPDSEPGFRTAVVMSIQDAIGLKNVLIQMLAGIEDQIIKATEEAAAQESKNA